MKESNKEIVRGIMEKIRDIINDGDEGIYENKVLINFSIEELVKICYTEDDTFAKQAILKLLENKSKKVRFLAYYYLSVCRHRLEENIIYKLNDFMDNPDNSEIVRQASEQYHVPLN